MSFSKNIKHYRKCISLTERYISDGPGTADAAKIPNKTMSVTHSKLLNHLKEYYNKYQNEVNFTQMFNRELVNLLQRLQPSVYGSRIVRRVETPTVKPELKVDKEKKVVEVPKDQSYSLPNYLNGLKLRMGKTEVLAPQEVKPKWMTTNFVVSKSSIMSRTTHVVSMIASAQSIHSRRLRIEDLSQHLQQYPEAKHHAIKAGAVRLLLRIRESDRCSSLTGSINEAFAIMGYNEPLMGRGIRVLAIDGGGTRGLLVIEMLKKLEELTGKRVYELFDLICGVSTGAIITCALGACQKELTSLATYYKDLSTKIFAQTPFWGTSNLVWSHSYYDTKVWEDCLKEYFGEMDMLKTARIPKCPKVAAVSAVVNQMRASAYVFRNYSLPYRVQSTYMGSSNHKVWEAVRASAAAPTYFEEFKLGNLLHQDGGIMYNNPTAVAIHEARQLWPNSPIQCVVSFGTGRTNPMHEVSEPVDTGTSSSWKNKFLKILDSATDTESVHTMLNDLLPPNVYYRFNPYLTEMINMVETRPDKLDQLERDALMYLRRNDDKFQLCAKTLTEPRTVTQKTLDWLYLQKEILGVTAKI